MLVEISKAPAIDPALQPDARSADLILAVATAAEHVQTAYLNAEEWKGCLTAKQYLGREAAIHDTDLTRNGGITCWILTSERLPPNADGTRPIFASCESILYHSDVARNGKVEQVIAHGIGTVYTRAEYRGKGYAGRMMGDLGLRLETWQQKHPQVKNAFSVLFSDIGPTYYARFGWDVYPSQHVHLEPLDQSSYELSKLRLPSVADLGAEDLPGLPGISYLQQRLSNSSAADSENVYVAIRPSVELFSWHHAREEFICRSIGKANPVVKGAIHKGSGIALIWTRIFAEDQKDWQLQILHTIIPPNAENFPEATQIMSALLLRSQFEAYQWGMLAGVELWEPSDLVLSSTKESGKGHVELIERTKESICCLRWSGDRDERPIWIGKQKYTWC